MSMNDSKDNIKEHKTLFVKMTSKDVAPYFNFQLDVSSMQLST